MSYLMHEFLLWLFIHFSREHVLKTFSMVISGVNIQF